MAMAELRRMLARGFNLCRNTGGPEKELDTELRAHLQLHIEDNVRAGMGEQEARRRALVALGGLEQTKERGRDQRLVPWMEGQGADALFGYRQLAKNKVTSAAAILSLALAIGSCTAAFRLIDA